MNRTPELLVLDPALVKDVLVSKFKHFKVNANLVGSNIAKMGSVSFDLSFLLAVRQNQYTFVHPESVSSN